MAKKKKKKGKNLNASNFYKYRIQYLDSSFVLSKKKGGNSFHIDTFAKYLSILYRIVQELED